MRIALTLIALAVLAMAVGGALLMRAGRITGGEYAMFLLALAMVCFFGSLPVLLGVLTRPRGGSQRGGDEEAVIIPDEPPRRGDASRP